MKLLQNGRGARLEPGELVWFSAVPDISPGFWRVRALIVSVSGDGLSHWTPNGLVLAGEPIRVPVFNGTSQPCDCLVSVDIEKSPAGVRGAVVQLYPGEPPQ